MIYGERIRQVRELRGWTQTELGNRLSVDQSFVAQVEGGWANPSEKFVTALAFQTGFPLSFFDLPPTTDFPLGSLLFRAHANMTDREQKAVYRHAQMAYEVVQWMVASRKVKEVPV